MDWLRALLTAATPSRASGVVLAAALGLLWAVGAVVLSFALVDRDEVGMSGFFLLMGMFVLPAGGALIGLGALLNRRWTARGLPLAAATCVFGLAWLFLGLGSSGDLGVEGGFVVSTLFLVLPVAATGGLAALHSLFAVGEVRREVEVARTTWLTEALDLRGRLDAETVLAHTGWSLARAEAVADAAGFDATVEGDRLRLDRVAERHRERILASVQARGRVPLSELEVELQEPRDALMLRVAELRDTGDFHGWVDGDTLCSEDLAALRALGRCPGCGGDLALAGLGLVTCRHCDAVVYL